MDSTEENDFTPPYIYVGLCEAEESARRPDEDAHVRDYYSLEFASCATAIENGELVLCYTGWEWVVSKGQIPIRHLTTFPAFT